MPGCECRFAIADDVSFRVCGLLLLCCDSEHLAWFLLIASALPSMEGPRQESQDGDGTVVSALVGLPDDVLSTNAQSAATSLPAPGCAQPGNPTSSTTEAAGCSPSTYHPACASGTSTTSHLPCSTTWWFLSQVWGRYRMAFLRIYSASAYVKGCERITMNVYSFHHAEDYCTAVSETRIQR